MADACSRASGDAVAGERRHDEAGIADFEAAGAE
jgi:hypothetical protein